MLTTTPKTRHVLVPTDVGRGLQIEKISPKLSRLVMPNKDQIIFWDGKPYATYDGSYIYLIYASSAAKAAITKHWPKQSILLRSLSDFEYDLGQVLSRAGLMLVRRPDA